MKPEKQIFCWDILEMAYIITDRIGDKLISNGCYYGNEYNDGKLCINYNINRNKLTIKVNNNEVFGFSSFNEHNAMFIKSGNWPELVLETFDNMLNIKVKKKKK